MERLYLLARDLVQPAIPESILDSQPIKLVVALERSLARPCERRVLLGEECVERRHFLLRLYFAARVGSKMDLRLQLLGALSRVSQIDVGSTANLLMARLTGRILVPQVIRPGGGRRAP